jgi:uncharacterized protein YbjT (DUF2867 family)
MQDAPVVSFEVQLYKYIAMTPLDNSINTAMQGEPHAQPSVAILGASGYVGGRLAPRLLRAGHHVKCLVRSPIKITSRQWANDPNLEVQQCDLTNETLLTDQLRGCDVLIYLVHSMRSAHGDYHEVDNQLAESTATACESAGVKQIIYLGGLGDNSDHLSRHLQSRREVEDHLRSGRVPVTTLRAAMIIGSGSSSFEILRYLVERLPIMITPRWVRTESQPISIRNVLQAITACAGTADQYGKTIDIGGSTVLSYLELMRLVAKDLKLPRRIVIPVPVLTPRLSSLWIHLVTPVDAAIARPLAEGLSNRVVCQNNSLEELIGHKPDSAAEAIGAAIAHARSDTIETSWTDSGPMPHDPSWAGGHVYEDCRDRVIDAPAPCVYEAISVIGGGHGYYKADWLWRLRGVMDRLVGGPGLRRGRRRQRVLHEGDALDFWRVLHADTNKRLVLFAEMKLPGTATLEFSIESTDQGTRLTQTAHFRPRGIAGLLYWQAIKPLHGFVFTGMLDGIKNEALRLSTNVATAT